MSDQITTITAWTEPRPSAGDVARFLAAWLLSAVTRQPMADLELRTIWTGRLTTNDPEAG